MNWSVGSGKSITTEESYVLTLAPGWNQIGNPFIFPVKWSDVIVNGDIQAPVIYEGEGRNVDGYRYNQTQILPWKGYYLNNQESHNTTIEILPFSASGTLLKKFSITDWIKNENDWIVQIKTECDRSWDLDNYIGQLSDAETGLDSYDFSEAPLPLGKYVSLYFPHKDWEKYPNIYTGDFRPFDSQGQKWDFCVKTNRMNQTINLSIEKILNFPANWKMILLNKTSHISFDFTKEENYSFFINEEGAITQFQLIVGDDKYIQSNNISFFGLPEDYKLLQNYPNPFNPETHIRYEIPANDWVKISVFNLKGQLVRKLVDYKQSAGRYNIQWDGKNYNDNIVTSGIYLVHFHAGDFLDVKKMILAR